MVSITSGPLCTGADWDNRSPTFRVGREVGSLIGKSCTGEFSSLEIELTR